MHDLVAWPIRLRDTCTFCGKGNVARMATRGVEVKLHVFLLLHRACCYDYLFYSNSCTLLHTFKNTNSQ